MDSTSGNDRDLFLEHWIPIQKAARNIRKAQMHKEYARILRMLGSYSTGKVLDIGCGLGATASYWADEGWNTFAVDMDQDVARIAKSMEVEGTSLREQKASAVHFLVGTAEYLPLQAGSFDICLCYSLLEHVSDYQAVLSEGVRLLRPGGLLVLITTNRFHPKTGEIRHIPLYPWLPECIKARLLKWIMEKRRDLVNYTDLPAVHWFTYPRLRRELCSLGMKCFDLLDVVEPEDLTGKRQLLKPILGILKRTALFRYLFYAYINTVCLYCVKLGDTHGVP